MVQRSHLESEQEGLNRLGYPAEPGRSGELVHIVDSSYLDEMNNLIITGESLIKMLCSKMCAICQLGSLGPKKKNSTSRTGPVNFETIDEIMFGSKFEKPPSWSLNGF
jgi:hypothetical protein